ncbi:MAG: hypothetical protein WCP34_16725 [Pseudomonadota bacterium]
MLNIIRSLIVAATLVALTTTPVLAAPSDGDQLMADPAAESFMIPVRSGHCEDLRLACENKDRLGEAGQGNCRKYREECGNRQKHCQNLRWRCMHKDDTGEEGKGLCRRYREECPSGGH